MNNLFSLLITPKLPMVKH